MKHIVFLSVQGVEKSNIIPHHKIEKLIVTSRMPYTFLRPAYFMQNFTGNLQNDLVHKNRIYLPAGKTKFTLVDVRDIGLASATIITNITQHINKAYDLTNNEKLSFAEMAEKLSHILEKNIQYKSPDLISFFLTKRKEKIPTMLILVMIMLHYLPRFQQEPKLSDWIKKITGKQAISFEHFIKGHQNLLT